MKKIENNFAVTGYVAKDAEVRQFTNAPTQVSHVSLWLLPARRRSAKKPSAYPLS